MSQACAFIFRLMLKLMNGMSLLGGLYGVVDLCMALLHRQSHQVLSKYFQSLQVNTQRGIFDRLKSNF